jgi:CheY-like chemotaxis protein
MTVYTAKSHADDEVSDLLRLNDAAHRHLVEALDRRMTTPKGADHRQDPRYRYMIPVGIVTLLKQGTIKTRARVRPRNISRSGLGFFHGGFLHIGTRCVFDLKTRTGDILQRPGTVRFCRHIFSHIHEIGAAFDEPIDVHAFVDGVVEAPEEAEAPVEKHFVGHVLCVDGSQVDRTLFRFHAIELGAHVAEADDAAEGLDLAFAADFDLIICGAALPSMSGQEFVQTLRDDGYKGPICIWCDGDASEVEDPDDDCHEVMPKPFNVEDIIDLLKRHLPLVASDPVTELPSSLWSHKRLRPIILSYLEVLAEQTARLDKDPEDQADELLPLIREIRNSAGSYGYASISETAEALLQRKPADDLVWWTKTLDHLRALCAGACLFGKRLAETAETAPHEDTP